MIRRANRRFATLEYTAFVQEAGKHLRTKKEDKYANARAIKKRLRQKAYRIANEFNSRSHRYGGPNSPPFYIANHLLQLILCQVVKIQKVMFYYVYVLESRRFDGKLYVGYTINIPKRLKEHNQGLNFSTKPFRPWNVIHYEAYLNKLDAERREKYLKSNHGSRLLKRMLKEYFYDKKYRSKN